MARYVANGGHIIYVDFSTHIAFAAPGFGVYGSSKTGLFRKRAAPARERESQ